jgi:hypothetical protein
MGPGFESQLDHRQTPRKGVFFVLKQTGLQKSVEQYTFNVWVLDGPPRGLNPSGITDRHLVRVFFLFCSNRGYSVENRRADESLHIYSDFSYLGNYILFRIFCGFF